MAAGVLPVPEVAGANLTAVADHVLPKWAYYVFVIGGAGCALASTLNNSLATSPKPLMQMCDDGWLPQSFAALNKKKVPWKIQTMYFVIGTASCLSGLSVSVLGNLTLVISGVTGIIIAVGTMKIPKLFPNSWAKSAFHVSQPVLNLFCIIALAGSLFSTYMNASSLSLGLLGFNVVVLVGAFLFGLVRGKKLDIQPTYEELV